MKHTKDTAADILATVTKTSKTNLKQTHEVFQWTVCNGLIQSRTVALPLILLLQGYNSVFYLKLSSSSLSEMMESKQNTS